MLADVLKFQFTMNARALDLNLEGISDNDAFVQPTGGGNCINWILGHIVANREPVLALLGEEPVWQPDVARRYERGSAPVLSASDAAAPMTSIRNAFALSQQSIVRGFERITTAQLEEPVGNSTRGQQLGFLQFHEAYHVGQIGLLRRFLGREGAIR